MASLADQIEKYLRRLIKRYQGEIEIKRNQLADDFDCAPSQINYVLKTRFPLERGYVVESQRGGGGYIRIIRVKLNSKKDDLQDIITSLKGPISERDADAVISRLFENDFITPREKVLMKTAVNRKVLGINRPHRDFVRGRIIRSMLEVILKLEKREG